MSEAVVAIIPARLGSTRFPGKVLAAETGRPLIQHVHEAVRAAGVVARVVIATDDRRVMEAARGFGAEAVMTRADHPNGTSRLAEAAGLLGLGERDIIVNVQGDEPEVEPGAIDAAVGVLCDGGERVQMGTVAVPFGPGEDARDPNCVKVVRGLDGCALYFSRSVIPFERDEPDPAQAARRAGQPVAHLRHVGLYTYSRAFLDRYAGLAETPLEKCERLEQLRALEHGFRIAVAVRASARIGIDTPEQYRAFVERWERGRGKRT